jgi:hypothetical protein
MWFVMELNPATRVLNSDGGAGKAEGFGDFMDN